MRFSFLSIISITLLFSCTKEIIQHKLSVSVSPINGGSVSPPSNSYEKNQSIQLLATPASEYLFKGWNGDLSGATNPINLLMDVDKQVIGTFEKRQYPLNLTIDGNGTVKEEVTIVALQSQYPSGTSVRLTAQSAEKHEFINWSGDISNSTNPIEIKIDKSISITAKFRIKDTDGDGVTDDIDQDNSSRKGVPVDATGRMLNPIKLDPNQVTIKANKWAIIGDKGKINNIEYEVVNREKLRDLINKGENYANVCTSFITDFSSLFIPVGQSSSTGLVVKYDISTWDVSNVTNMEFAFSWSTLNFDISKWDVGKVTNMKGMFSQAIFNQDIPNWNVSNVETMEAMFMNSSFNGNLSKWNIINLKSMILMFYGCKFNNSSLNNWNTKKVENMANAFSNSSFNQDISNWDVSSVTTMTGMFSQNFSFNQDLSKWNVGSVTLMNSMFNYCTSFNQNLSNWNVSKVTEMVNMFSKCYNFNQDLSKWNVNNVIKCFNFNINATGWKLPKPNFKNCTF